MSYWTNVRGVLSILDENAEHIVRSLGNIRDVAKMGDYGDDLDRAKLTAAVRDLKGAVRNTERLLSTLESLTDAAVRVSSKDPSRQGEWDDRLS